MLESSSNEKYFSSLLVFGMSLYPYAGVHAIQSAAFVVEWAGELTAGEIAQIAALHSQLSESFPSFSPIQSFKLEIVGQGQSMPTSSIGGYVFQKNNATGNFSKTLEVNHTRVTALINDYTRWEYVWKDVRGWFEKVIPLIGDRQILHAGLQYNDIFHWRGELGDLNIKDIFLEASPYIAKHIFEVNGLWHSHHGYLIDHAKPENSKLLENINVSASINEAWQRSFIITTVHKMQLLDARILGWNGLASHLDELMNTMHNRNKEVLKKILTPAVLAQIDLT
jgi:uncharacterized protein (TIGR04255 family)